MPKCEICKSAKIKFFHKLSGYNYFECLNCLTLFLFPKPSFKAISAFYRNNFFYPAGEANEILIRNRAKKIIKTIKKLHPSGKTLMDIGSGYGFFLDEARILNLKISGIEPSSSLINTPINQLIGLKLHQGSLESYLQKNQKMQFDFVTLIHLIEHVANPKTMLNQAIGLLKKDGILYIETPNLQSRLFNAEKKAYTFLTPPDHLWVYSLRSMEVILKPINGIEIIKKSTYSQPEHCMGVIKKYLKNSTVKQTFTDKKNPRKKTGGVSKPEMTNQLKYLIFDKLIAPLLTPCLNLGGYGSILELYIKKI